MGVEETKSRLTLYAPVVVVEDSYSIRNHWLMVGTSPIQRNCHSQVVRVGAILALCDSVIREANDDAECTTWLLVDHLHDLLDLVSSESIVREFFIHLFRVSHRVISLFVDACEVFSLSLLS